MPCYPIRVSHVKLTINHLYKDIYLHSTFFKRSICSNATSFALLATMVFSCMHAVCVEEGEKQVGVFVHFFESVSFAVFVVFSTLSQRMVKRVACCLQRIMASSVSSLWNRECLSYVVSLSYGIQLRVIPNF